MYSKCLKRVIDFTLSLIAVILLSPILLILIIVGAIAMRGNPFFVQSRPGKIRKKTGEEKIFKLIKLRTMTNAKDKDGKLLPNEKRLNKYGRILRKTSVDELPELLNILKGDMAIVGPRPLLPEYIPYYTEEERKRHSVRPGLTGWAQVNGRNSISSWEERFEYDLQYVEKCSFAFDIKILFKTVVKVFKRADVLDGANVVVGRLDEVRSKQEAREEVEK